MMKRTIAALMSLCCLFAAESAHAAATLENARFSLTVESAKGPFSVKSKSSGKTLLTDGRFAEPGESLRAGLNVNNKALGDGQGIEIVGPGQRTLVAVFPDSPFILFRTTLHNGKSEADVLNRVPGVSAAVDLGRSSAEIVTLGTGGLLAPAKNPGSYAFLAVADRQTRGGVVAGWLTQERGSGIVFSPVQDGKVRVQSQLDHGRLRIPAGQDVVTESFLIGYFDDARLGLEAYADAIARQYAIKLPPQHPGYCTWYMEKHGGACDEKRLAELSAYAAKNLKPFGFDFIQIDDGWQEGIATNGPKKNFTTHAPKGPYPGGMKATADGIRGLGLTPGIWFMPFAGNHKDPFFKDHQDWFAKGRDGKPYETEWGGTCLDMTQPGAREHLRSVVRRIAHDWGYRVFKMDGLWTGSATKQIYVNDGYKDDAIGEAGPAKADVTNVEAFRQGLKLVREAAGPDIFLLGCCVSQNMRSFGGSFGLLDAMRVGPDTGAGHIGAPHASRLWFLNGRVWWNDPDCVSVRTGTPLEQARLNASFTTIAGDLFYNSDWMPDLPPERLDILRRCIPSHNLPSRPVDVLEHEPARVWHLADTRASRRDIVALYNWDNRPATIAETAERIGLPPAKEYVGFDFWANQFLPPFGGTLRAELPAGGSCRILAIQPRRDRPQLVSTSRHITQGIVDVTGETWDAAGTTLSATSKVVANDPYELRIVVPTGEKSWRGAAATLSAADQAAGVTASLKQEGARLRVVIHSPASRDVKWQVRFEVAKEADRWEANIKAFETSDQKKMPPKEGIVFVGSSTIVGWNVGKSFPDLPVVNRGFGGSQLADSVRYADRIVVPYRPKIVVLYAGDNDLASGKSPETIAADYRAFVAKIHKALPEAKVIYLAIKPCGQRWRLIDKVRQANALIEAEAKKDPRETFVDLGKLLLGPDGKPRKEFFQADELHLNAEGYRLWSDALRPQLKLP
jgi:lysophospholipase L1-like esterase